MNNYNNHLQSAKNLSANSTAILIKPAARWTERQAESERETRMATYWEAYVVLAALPGKKRLSEWAFTLSYISLENCGICQIVTLPPVHGGRQWSRSVRSEVCSNVIKCTAFFFFFISSLLDPSELWDFPWSVSTWEKDSGAEKCW